MTLVAVADKVRVRGVFPPDWQQRTYDWREPLGSPGNTARIEPAFAVSTIERALCQNYRTDAHLATYLVQTSDGASLERQPRINKAALPWMTEQGFSLVVPALWVDLDNPGHGRWTADLVDEAEEQHRTLPAFRTAGWYYTRSGRRIIQPLVHPLVVAYAEAYLERYLLELERQGLRPDWACRDWTRLFRLPSVKREDGPSFRRAPVLDNMSAIELPSLADADADETRATLRIVRSVPAVDWARELPPTWRPRVARIAAVVRDGVGASWHEMYLALAGALLGARVAPELVPVIVRAVARAAQSNKPESHARSAQDTVTRSLAGLPVTGQTTLLERWPGVAAALAFALVMSDRNTAPENVALPTAAEASEGVADAIRTAPDGVSVIVAGCGVGKTRAAETVAIERAATPYRTTTATGARAPAHSQTGISAPTNELALEITQRLRARGARVLRVFSPVSLRGADGQPVCKYAASARSLADGGQSIRRELCEGRGRVPCRYRDACPAADGIEGPVDARIAVTNHGLVDEVSSMVGTTGLLVVDEPPGLLVSWAITSVDLECAVQYRTAFESNYTDAMAPALALVTARLRAGTGEESAEQFEQWCPLTAEQFGAVVDVVPDPGAPPLRLPEVLRARESTAYAADLGRASRVYRAIHTAVVGEARYVARVELRREVRTLIVTGPSVDYIRALRRQGRVVVLDATPDVDVLARALDYRPPVSDFHARDGAEITRTWIQWASGARRHLLPDRDVAWDRLVPAIRTAIRWALEIRESRTLALISHLPIELLIAHALNPDDPRPRERWTGSGRRLEQLATGRAKLAPVLAEWPGTWLLGHYGGLRGLDGMRDCDALVTLGDPWPQVVDAREGAAYLELPDWEARLERAARADLEQAHGRLRAPHRQRPGRALHMGKLLPSGPGWSGSNVEVRATDPGRPRNEQAMAPDDLRAWVTESGLSLRGAAKVAGVSHTQLTAYLRGEYGIPAAVVDRLRLFVSGRKTAYEERVISGFPATVSLTAGSNLRPQYAVVLPLSSESRASDCSQLASNNSPDSGQPRDGAA